jgi:general secretion pathway protein G
MRERGFTLIELLIVIAIIGILSSIIFVAVRVAVDKAHDSARISEVSTLEKSLEIYEISHDSVPPSLGSGANVRQWLLHYGS